MQMTRGFILDVRSLVRLQENDLPSNPSHRSEPSVDIQELWGDIRRWRKQALRMRILQMLRGTLGIVEQQSGQQTLSYGNTIALTPSKCAPDTDASHSHCISIVGLSQMSSYDCHLEIPANGVTLASKAASHEE